MIEKVNQHFKGDQMMKNGFLYEGASAVGQFLSNDNQGGTGFNNAYRGGQGKQSREITLKKAKDRIGLRPE